MPACVWCGEVFVEGMVSPEAPFVFVFAPLGVHRSLTVFWGPQVFGDVITSAAVMFDLVVERCH